jgi:6-phosphogluconolactonase
VQLHILSPENFSQTVAGWMVSLIQSTLEKKDRFLLVLSGGNTPKALHGLLAHSPYREKIAWEKIHIFWGDERAVPFTDERNNAKMAFDTLLNLVPVPKNQIHIMQTGLPPEHAATAYEEILRTYFPDDGSPTFDLVLLGMGDDGHTLSLFPGTEAVHEENRWTIAYYLLSQQMFRITLTRPVVNRSQHIAFLSSGAGKAHALKEVLQGKENPDLYPAQTIKPVHGELHWFVDEAAAAQLSK